MLFWAKKARFSMVFDEKTGVFLRIKLWSVFHHTSTAIHVVHVNQINKKCASAQPKEGTVTVNRRCR